MVLGVIILKHFRVYERDFESISNDFTVALLLVDLWAIACVGGRERRFPKIAEEVVFVIIVITFWAFMSKKLFLYYGTTQSCL